MDFVPAMQQIVDILPKGLFRPNFELLAVAAGFACDQRQYRVIFVTHSAHEYVSSNLAEKNVAFVPVSSPPILSAHQCQNTTGSAELSFSLQKKMLIRDHRQECYSILEKIFGRGPCLDDDFIVINFFALEGWSLAELFRVRCIVAAPYVVPYSAPSSFERQFKKEHPLLYKYLQEAPMFKVCWKDVIHWLWPLFTEYWESWRYDLNLSSCPFTDPVTDLPEWHNRPSSPLLLYGFSKEVVECPDLEDQRKAKKIPLAIWLIENQISYQEVMWNLKVIAIERRGDIWQRALLDAREAFVGPEEVRLLTAMKSLEETASGSHAGNNSLGFYEEQALSQNALNPCPLASVAPFELEDNMEGCLDGESMVGCTLEAGGYGGRSRPGSADNKQLAG
ncbi:hypothetical protein L484_024183 [Morus notabilis]|uniref:Uncharacterized protein n=1 Tax=Morus notabilis TaxID=981085 RepID=W9RLZ0_9ROSA|nr:hypothetical protein L484_024183 [Morus notabilis]